MVYMLFGFKRYTFFPAQAPRRQGWSGEKFPSLDGVRKSLRVQAASSSPETSLPRTVCVSDMSEGGVLVRDLREGHFSAL